jgi:hypothetical protein
VNGASHFIWKMEWKLLFLQIANRIIKLISSIFLYKAIDVKVISIYYLSEGNYKQ